MIVLRGFSQWFAPHRREAFTQCAKGRPGEIRSKMHVNNTTHTSKTRGQSLIEFALLAPILLLLILGAMDFGRLFYTKIVITNAAREGANYLSRFPNEADNDYANMINVIEAEATSSGIDPSMLTIPLPPQNCCTQLEEIGVMVQIIDMNLIFGNFYQLFLPAGESIDLSSTVWMVVQ
jgi:hypothetical protein